jgi:hypothetical protein
MLGGAEKTKENLNREICDRSIFKTDTFQITTRALLLGTPVRGRQKKKAEERGKKVEKKNGIQFYSLVFFGETSRSKQLITPSNTRQIPYFLLDYSASKYIAYEQISRT